MTLIGNPMSVLNIVPLSTRLTVAHMKPSARPKHNPCVDPDFHPAHGPSLIKADGSYDAGFLWHFPASHRT